MKVYTDSLHKIAYATDASVYREIPYGVAYPETVEDIRELMQLAREKGVDLIPRAGGTSLAGQVIGSGIVVDISKHWTDVNKVWNLRKAGLGNLGSMKGDAKQIARQNVRLLKEVVTDEAPLVGIEPSCILSFRDESLLSEGAGWC